MSGDDFVPKILCFLCQWCGYNAADQAGSGRISYPASLRAIEVTCSGMVHPDWVIEPLLKGIDGVMIVGCHLGQCHYGSGNESAMGRKELIEETLSDLGIDKERFFMGWVSAAEAARFAQMVSEMTERLKGLGPNPAFGRPRVSLKAPSVKTENGLVHHVNGKNYYWDGRIYREDERAQKAISRYLDMGFEAKLVPKGKRILIYTRRDINKEGDNGRS